MRVGIGYDIHPFEPGRVLVLGGIKMEGAWGLKGHSDADVVLHAIADALLGAAGLGDLGDHFPDTDAQWKDVPSAVLVSEVMTKVRAKGWQVRNADLTVITERPKIAIYREAMVERIAALLDVTPRDVNVKATTHEGLGAVGRGEGIATHAVVLLTDADA